MSVRGLKSGIAGGPSGMCAEDLKGWLRKAKREKYPKRRRWELVVRLVQVIFGYENIPEEVSWATMVILPKGKGGYRGIGMVEVLWKVFSVVVNCFLKIVPCFMTHYMGS